MAHLVAASRFLFFVAVLVSSSLAVVVVAAASPDVETTSAAVVVGGGDDDDASQKTGPREFKIAAILPFMTNGHRRSAAVGSPPPPAWPFSRERVAPAIDIARENVAGVGGLLRGVRLTVRYADSHCDAAESLNQAITYYIRKEVDVFFGPCCDYAMAPVARQMKYWDVPLISAAAMARDFAIDRRRNYPMLTRVGANFNSLAVFLAALLKRYGWAKVKLVYNPLGHADQAEKFCHLAADGFHQELLKPENRNITQDYFKFLEDAQFKEHITDEIGKEYASTWSSF